MKFIDAALKHTTSHKIPNILKEKKTQSANALRSLKQFPPKSESWKYTAFRHLNNLLYSQKPSEKQSLSTSSKEKNRIFLMTDFVIYKHRKYTARRSFL